MARVLAKMSEDLRGFLDARMIAQAEDEEIAYRIAFSRVESDDLKAKNWFDVVAGGSAATLLSYATLQGVEKVRIRHGANVDPWEYGSWRITVRPGGFAREITGIEDGRKLEVFTGALSAHFGKVDDIRVLEGSDIIKYYNHRFYCGCVGLGDLSSSCMRYDGYEKRFEIYRDNAKMLAVFCPMCEKIRGRAILWSVNDDLFIDRRYGSSAVQTKMMNWAKENGYTSIWGGRGAYRENSRIVIPVKKVTYEEAAYLDSVPYWCRTCNTLSNRDCGDRSHDIVILQGVQGTNHAGWWGRCPSCHSTYHDHRRVCQNTRRCTGCGTSYCGDECPNGCWYCTGCGDTQIGSEPCKNGCAECQNCHHRTSRGYLSISHGLCRDCNHRIRAAAPPRDIVFRWRPVGGWSANCPSCGYYISTPSSTFRTSSVLIRCNNVHGGDAYPDANAGHCPSCYEALLASAPSQQEEQETA